MARHLVERWCEETDVSRLPGSLAATVPAVAMTDDREMPLVPTTNRSFAFRVVEMSLVGKKKEGMSGRTTVLRFALTGGVMTRCESTKALVTDTLDCGNFYVNRDVVGAVVESQPFGGHGLSGNGVKAGSEGYLEQFVAHKVICEDTTAAGGNVELMRTTN